MCSVSLTEHPKYFVLKAFRSNFQQQIHHEVHSRIHNSLVKCSEESFLQPFSYILYILKRKRKKKKLAYSELYALQYHLTESSKILTTSKMVYRMFRSVYILRDTYHLLSQL